MPSPLSHTQPLSYAETHNLSHAATNNATINFTSLTQPSFPFAKPSLLLDPSPFTQHRATIYFTYLRQASPLRLAPCLLSPMPKPKPLSLGPWIYLGKVLVWVRFGLRFGFGSRFGFGYYVLIGERSAPHKIGDEAFRFVDQQVCFLTFLSF